MLQAPVALFIFILTIGTSFMAFNRETRLYERFIFQPWAVARGKRLHTLLTHGLIHADGLHLLFNMISFYFFAFKMEQIWVIWAEEFKGTDPLMGHLYFLALYAVGLAASCAGTLVKHRKDPEYLSLGASGAITALIFSFVIFAPGSTIYFFVIPIPAPLFAVLYLAGSHYAAKHDRLSHINHDSHFWGAVSGLAVTLLLAPRAYLMFGEYIYSLGRLVLPG